MRTIGHKAPADLPPGDYEAMCAYCGVPWYRSMLVKDEAQRLCCPPCVGEDEVALKRQENPPEPDKEYPRDGLYPAIDPFEDEVRVTGEGLWGDL